MSFKILLRLQGKCLIWSHFVIGFITIDIYDSFFRNIFSFVFIVYYCFAQQITAPVRIQLLHQLRRRDQKVLLAPDV